jgi:hypothetical protein
VNGLNLDRLAEVVGQCLPKLIGIDVTTVFHSVSLGAWRKEAFSR